MLIVINNDNNIRKSIELTYNNKDSIAKGLEFIENNKNFNLSVRLMPYNDRTYFYDDETGMRCTVNGHDEFIIHDNYDFFKTLSQGEFAQNISFQYQWGSNDIFSLEKIINDEDFLRAIAKDIKSRNFSQLETAMAVYDIVQSVKPYKDVPDRDFYVEASSLYEYLNNNYMICGGFSDFVTNLGHMLGQNYSTIIYNQAKHALNYVNLIDEKYDINGYYVLDSTVANTYGKDFLNRKYEYFLVETDKIREDTKHLVPEGEELKDFDTIFTYKDVEDFAANVLVANEYDSLMNYNTAREDSTLFQMELNGNRLKEQLRNLDPKFFEQFQELDLFGNKQDIQKVIDYFKAKINNPIDKRKIVEAKMFLEQSTHKNLSNEDIEDMRSKVTKLIYGYPGSSEGSSPRTNDDDLER